LERIIIISAAKKELLKRLNMSKVSQYISKEPDENGFINWSDEENAIWSELITRQLKCIEGKACDEYMAGLKLLNLPTDKIPQLEDVSKVLRESTGWQCEPVPALISFDKFFELLANKKFPVATFIRCRDVFDYLKEPDIFHEIFGHCGMLTNKSFADFTHKYGQIGLQANKKDRIYLARLYWFTIEFGLMMVDDQIRIYGGGVLSSPGETQYVYSGEAKIVPLEVVNVLRTPYRIDIMQPIYHTINSIDDLFDISNMDLMSLVEKAKALGLHKPLFEPKEKLAS
jgi:phenylalanine-4-hydroxylase